MTVDFGFCLESRDEEEMPETLMGCITMNKVNVAHAVPFIRTTDSTTRSSTSNVGSTSRSRGSSVEGSTAPQGKNN